MAIFPEQPQIAQAPMMMAPQQMQAPPIQPDAPALMPTAEPVIPPQMPMGGQYYNPMADRNPSVMQNDPQLQGMLKEAYHAKLHELIHGNKEDGAGKAGQVFTAIAAPLTALFGGAPGAIASNDLVRQARQDTAAAKQRTEAHEQSAIMTLRHLADIESTTGLKPWSQAIKDFRQAQGQGIKDKGLGIQQQKADDAKSYHERLLKAKDAFRNTYENLKKDDQKLKAMGINFNYDKLDQAKEIAGQQDKRMRDIAAINAKVRLQTASQADLTNRARILHAYQHDNAWLGMETQKHNDYLEKISSERDPLTGKPKYADEKGNPVDFRKYKTEFPAMQPGATAPDPQDMASALELLQQGGPQQAPTAPYGQEAAQMQQAPMQQPQPQAPQAAAPAPVIKSGISEIARAYKHSPEESKRLFIDSALKHGYTYEQAVKMSQGK